MNLPTDLLGRTIRAGDTIACPWRKGSAMGLNRLTVSQVTDEFVTGCNHLGHHITIRNLKNVVVVKPRETA